MKQDRIEIEYHRLADLIPDDRNPRRNDMAVKPVAESIKQFGMRVPIVVDKTGRMIISGHTRYKACQMLGIEEVPCVRADKLTLKQQRAFSLADNKTGELATWDMALLESELDNLASIFDISALGFELKVKQNEKPEPKREKDEDGMIVCPRCGRKFLPDGYDPYDEVGDIE